MVINPTVGFKKYSLQGFPIKGGMTIPDIRSLDPGTSVFFPKLKGWHITSFLYTKLLQFINRKPSKMVSFSGMLDAQYNWSYWILGGYQGSPLWYRSVMESRCHLFAWMKIGDEKVPRIQPFLKLAAPLPERKVVVGRQCFPSCATILAESFWIETSGKSVHDRWRSWVFLRNLRAFLISLWMAQGCKLAVRMMVWYI